MSDDDDVIAIRLTPKGIALADQIIAAVEEAGGKPFGEMTPDERLRIMLELFGDQP
jgi:hypothetical protein